MAVKKTIFKNIGDYLMQTIKDTDDGLPDLAWFDKQMGQFESPELAFALPLPTVLMEFGQFNWQTVGQNSQKGEGSIRIHIYFENYANSFTGSLNQELALQFFEFTEAVHVALQGYGIAGVLSPLQRIGDAEDVAQDMIITSVMDYSATIFDDVTALTRNFIDVDPDLEVNYKKESSRPPVFPPDRIEPFLI